MAPTTKNSRFGLFLLLSLLSLLTSRGASSSAAGGPPRSFGLQAAIQQIPRGGGWFGGGNNNNNKNRKDRINRRARRNGRNKNRRNAGFGGGDDGDGNNPHNNKRYPSLTQAEIEEKLNVPVFAIADKLGNSIVARAANEEEHVQYLFLSQKMAQQALESIQRNKTITGENGEVQLKLLSLHLGKMWFRYLQNETEANTLYELKTPHPSQTQPHQPQSTSLSAAPATKKKVIFRLVPDARNLISARLMTTINPEEIQEAMATGDQAEIQAIVQKATLAGKNFTSPFNEIPLFLIPTMRAQKTTTDELREEDGSSSGENSNNQISNGQPPRQQPRLKMPIFLGAKDLVHAFLQHQKETMAFNAANNLNNNDPSNPNKQQFTTKVSVTSLHSLVEMMQQESDFDFRSIVIFPLNEEEDDDTSNNNNNDDDDDSDDNDGGRGDFGVSASSQEDEFEPQIEMFTSFATNDGWTESTDDNGYYQQTLSM